MKRFMTLLLSALLLLGSLTATPVFAASQLPNTLAEAYILIDMTTGEVLAEKNSEEALYPASTTKIMTALLAIENLDLDASWTADREVYATGGSRLTLINGEVCNIKDVLYASMIKSANDGSVFLAKAVAGSTEAFVAMMNERALALGCVNTCFKNPSGLHEEGHYSCAADLGRIALCAMQNPVFRDVVRTPSYVMRETNLSGERTVQNTNLMLYDCTEANRVTVNGVYRYCKYDGCTGIKTGYTPEAQGCLVSSAERNGTKLLCVVLKSSTLGRFSDSIGLLDWGFENFRTEQVMSAGLDMGVASVKKGSVRTVGVLSSEDVILTLPAEASGSLIRTEVSIMENVPAPVFKGQEIGELTIYEGGIEIGRYPLLAAADVPEGGFLSNFGIEDALAEKILRIGAIVLGSLLLLAILFFAVIFYIAYKRKKKRAAARAARRKAKAEAEERRRQEWMRRFDSRYQMSREDEE